MNEVYVVLRKTILLMGSILLMALTFPTSLLGVVIRNTYICNVGAVRYQQNCGDETVLMFNSVIEKS